MRTIDEAIEDWKTEYGTMAYGKHGAFYRYIDWKVEKNLLLNLAQTLLDEGYTKEDLLGKDGKPNSTIQMKVINACSAPEGASNRSKTKIKKSKDITAKNWKEVLKEFFRGSVSSFTLENRVSDIKKEPTFVEKPKSVEKYPELDPKDRIRLDTTGIADAPLDLEFLNEIGVDESFVTGKKNE